MTGDDDRRAEIEAEVAWTTFWQFASLPHLQRMERVIAAVDRVRDARGDEALPVMDRDWQTKMAARSSQDEDHEEAWRVVASMPHATYAVLKPVICALGGQIESAGVGGWLGKAREQSEPSFARPEQPPPDTLGGQPPAEPPEAP